MMHCVKSNHFGTATTRRSRREKALNSTTEEIEQTAEKLVDSILKVHRALGPGLLKSTDQGRH
jgi:hypothetical protein